MEPMELVGEGNNIMMKLFKVILVALSLMTILTACSPEVGSEAWCKELKKKDKGDWTANEAKDFIKHCAFK